MHVKLLGNPVYRPDPSNRFQRYLGLVLTTESFRFVSLTTCSSLQEATYLERLSGKWYPLCLANYPDTGGP